MTITGGTFCSGNSYAVYLSNKCRGSISNATMRYVADGFGGVSARPSTVTLDKAYNGSKRTSCW